MKEKSKSEGSVSVEVRSADYEKRKKGRTWVIIWWNFSRFIYEGT
jgi:hypothetical protein